MQKFKKKNLCENFCKNLKILLWCLKVQMHNHRGTEFVVPKCLLLKVVHCSKWHSKAGFGIGIAHYACLEPPTDKLFV